MEINSQIILKKTNGIEYLHFKRLLDYNIKNAYALK